MLARFTSRLPASLRTLRVELSVQILALAAVALLALAWVASSRSTAVARKEAYAQLSDLASGQAAQLDGQVRDDWRVARTLAAAYSDRASLSDTDVVADVQRVAAANPRLTAVYAGWEPGAFPGAWRAVPGNVAGRAGVWFHRNGGRLEFESLFDDPMTVSKPENYWFTHTRSANADTVVEPYADEGNHLLMTSYLAPIRQGGRFIGLVGVDKALGSLSSELARLHADNGKGYVMAVSPQGTFLAAPKRSAIGTTSLQKLARDEKVAALGQIAKAVAARRSGHLTMRDPFTGQRSVLAWSPVPSTGWAVIASEPLSAVLADAHTLRNQLLLVALIALLAVALLVTLLARRIAAPIVQLAQTADTWGTGDLRPRVELKRADELGRLADSLNEMVEGLASIAGRLGESADEVAATSNEMLATVGDQKSAAARQSSAMNDTSAAAEQVQASADQAAQRASDVAAHARAAEELNQRGAEAVEAIAAGMESVSEAVGSIATQVAALSEHTGHIGEITATVADISEQSSMLALNAAIEAARSGEAGKGFAVVAGEVRKLATQSKDATERVGEILATIGTATAEAVQTAEAGRTVVEQQVLAAERAREVNTEVSAANGHQAEEAAAIADAAEQQRIGMAQITAAVRDTSQATGRLVAGVEESRTAVERLTALSAGLAQLAGQYRV